MRSAYSERAHDEALAQHERRWDEMHLAGLRRGTDSPEYAQALALTIEAKREVRRVALKRWRRPR